VQKLNLPLPASQLSMKTCSSLTMFQSTAMETSSSTDSSTARHQSFNDVVSRAFASTGITATKEPSGLVRGDGKYPDGLTVVPWQSGKPLPWDVTIFQDMENRIWP